MSKLKGFPNERAGNGHGRSFSSKSYPEKNNGTGGIYIFNIGTFGSVGRLNVGNSRFIIKSSSLSSIIGGGSSELVRVPNPLPNFGSAKLSISCDSIKI